jgi:uroporphyrin-III C-methyltransferase
MKTAKLTLIGAGPGDPELISLKGIRILKEADVILYDALVHPDLLEYAKPHAHVEFVGKRAGRHSYSQTEINELIVAYALTRGHVVRLKGGDPFVFGRGKEEMEYAETFGISCTCIPGISSVTLPGHYGIPLTRRGINESFWVVTATTSNGNVSADVALAAKSSATGVFLMGLGKTDQICAAYRASGKGFTPAAIISRGSLPEGEVYYGSVDTLEDIKRRYNPKAPALIIVGEAVGTHPHFYQLVKQLKNEHIGKR